MARGGAGVEIDWRHAPDLGQLLRERPPAPGPRALARRSHRRDAPLLERRRRFALAPVSTANDTLSLDGGGLKARVAGSGPSGAQLAFARDEIERLRGGAQAVMALHRGVEIAVDCGAG